MQDDQRLELVLAKPIIVIGAPRSGTSVLAWTLREHHSLAFFEEPRLLWKYGNDRKSDMLKPNDARPEVIRHIRAAFRRGVQHAGKTRICEKTPSNALRLGFIDRVFPDARYVHIIRHGLDSVLSIRAYWQGYAAGMRGKGRVRLRQRLGELNVARMPLYAREFLGRMAPGPLGRLLGPNVWGPRIPGVRGLLKDLDLLEVACLQWRMCVEAACHDGRQLGPQRYLECRLEQMSPDLIKTVLDFCELDDDPNVTKAFEQLFDPSLAGARKKQADPQEVELVMRWIGPTLHWLGDE